MEDDRTEVIETTPRREVSETTPRRTEIVNATPHVTEVKDTARPSSAVDRTESVAYDPFEKRRLVAHRLTQLIYWLFGLVEGLIAIRVVLKALGANPSAGFAEFIYGTSGILVAPFVGLFGNPQSQGTVLELNSIVALVVYALIAWLLARLVWIAVGETRSAVTTRSTSFDSRT
jgi:YGGT family